jgi:V8-like Glu-specific endopeptidase
MNLLPDPEADNIIDIISTTIGYSSSVRKILLGGINSHFKALMDSDDNDFFQLSLDVQRLNRTPKLTDGTVPFIYWLEKAARLVKPFPYASEIIQVALSHILQQFTSVQPDDVTPPTANDIGNMQLEKVVHQNDMVSYAFLESGFIAGKSVTRAKVPRYDDGVLTTSNGEPSIYLGTGWLLTENLVITNYHVINARDPNQPLAKKSDFLEQAIHTIIEFDYNADNKPGKSFNITGLEAADQTLDYAILRYESTERKPLSLLPNVITIPQNNTPAVNIIQHPSGFAKKVALRNNHIYDCVFPRVRYFTDTEGGSSGSPVFNDNWQVIALHRASRLVDNVSYMGKKTAWVNEGTQLSAIFDHLEKNYKSLFIEINAVI